ncbi:MAG: transcriptional repressor NrdR [Actinobacteria bacterium]|nr:MAG: transcriptional repressor NrdR [Actinomycetota bacterium]
MHCPFCESPDTHVLETREAAVGLRRRRECAGCGRRFTTYERAEPAALVVIKRDGRREPFERDKLLRGLLRAAVKRPVEVGALEAVADRVAGALLAAGGELGAESLGELVLRELRGLDPVAYVRFASVYRAFSDPEDFAAELARLEERSGRSGSGEGGPAGAGARGSTGAARR